jgi:hypothetical protein
MPLTSRQRATSLYDFERLLGDAPNLAANLRNYQPPRPLPEIEADIKTLEREILEMLREVAG